MREARAGEPRRLPIPLHQHRQGAGGGRQKRAGSVVDTGRWPACPPVSCGRLVGAAGPGPALAIRLAWLAASGRSPRLGCRPLPSPTCVLVCAHTRAGAGGRVGDHGPLRSGACAWRACGEERRSGPAAFSTCPCATGGRLPLRHATRQRWRNRPSGVSPVNPTSLRPSSHLHAPCPPCPSPTCRIHSSTHPPCTHLTSLPQPPRPWLGSTTCPCVCLAGAGGH